MIPTPPWQELLADHFPGYLLPAAANQSLDPPAAARFLERLSGERDLLQILRGVSLLAARAGHLRAFVDVLARFVADLPSTSRVVREEFEGGYRGRLDVRATLAARLGGHVSRFVARVRHREIDLAENVFVKAIATRVLGLLTLLRSRHLLKAYGWSEEASTCEGLLRSLLTMTRLRDIADEPISGRHYQAAGAARHPAYGQARAWHDGLRDALDDDDSARIAALVAQGALAPLAEETRFELAVCIRLIQQLEASLERRSPGDWLTLRSLVLPDRSEIAVLRRQRDGAEIRVLYNQVPFACGGPRDEAILHYFGAANGLRPDVTIVVATPGQPHRAAVVEVKLSPDVGYQVSGFAEAIVYRHEYREYLTGWPKSILVTSEPILGPVRAGDDVIAVGWRGWVPQEVVEGLLEGL